ncbi:MAG: hypothetical protein LUI87_14855 [Lachnospiraceae bacterium]|nr:hypothetical protein [Lachnospiraceae bacterium]
MDEVRYLHVTSTPVQSIAFYTNLVWEDDRAVCGDNVQEQFKPNGLYILDEPEAALSPQRRLRNRRKKL